MILHLVVPGVLSSTGVQGPSGAAVQAPNSGSPEDADSDRALTACLFQG
jgi:hypothetical protein